MRRSTAIRATIVLGSLIALAVALVFLITQVRPAGEDEGAASGSAESVEAGSRLYEAHCSRCHGADARGGGPDAGTTPVRPPSLVSGHITEHSDEEIFMIISEGLPGGMPAWEETLTETERRQLVDYLRSLQES